MHKYLKQILFAKEQFGDLKDGSGTLIFDHAVRVFAFLDNFLKPFKIDQDLHKSIVLAGLFHDLLEDTKATEAEILALSDKKTLSLVKEMTISFTNRTIKQAVKPLYKTTDELTLVKLADIYDNAKKSNFMIRVNGLKWYQTFFSPLLNEYKKLMIDKIKKAKKHKKIIKILADLVFQEVGRLELNLEISSLFIKN